MWIFTVNGFFTFVIDRKDPTKVWLRARLREDLERNFPGVTVEAHPGADYLFRAKIDRSVLAARMFDLVMEADVTSHFKDEMIRRAAKPKFGNRSQMMYAIWNAGAAMQPYAPYSKTPRTKVTQTWKNTPADRKPGAGQTVLGFGGPASTYGGTGSGRYASEFDWDTRDWGGKSTPDPKLSPAPAEPFQPVSDEDWAAMTEQERGEYLDAEEAAFRAVELQEDFGAAARAAEFVSPEVVDVFPSPRQRPGTHRKSRRGKRRNRHNQEGLSDRQIEQRDRQTYLANKEQRRNGMGA